VTIEQSMASAFDQPVGTPAAHVGASPSFDRGAFDRPPTYAAGTALAPPQSEVGAPPWSHEFSWPKWYPIRQGRCKTFVGAELCGMESDMWSMVRALITPAHSVLELGARYGTTSCVLAQATNNSGRVVSVEPDGRVAEALRANRATHRCNFGIFHGTSGFRSQVLMVKHPSGGNKSYEVRTRDARESDKACTAEQATENRGCVLANLPPLALERLSGLIFTALVVDCEGCLGGVLSQALLDARREPPLELLLLEADVPRKVNYFEVHARLERYGFRRIWHLEDSLFEWKAPRHVAYQRGSRPTPSCLEFAQAQGWRCAWNEKRKLHKCGSRLTCLPADVAAGSSEFTRLQVARAKVTKERHAPTRHVHVQYDTRLG
jgi:FkbM family methyltransferase